MALSSREIRLRSTIDHLRERVASLEDELTETRKRKRALTGRCGYCGAPCRGRACRAHSDLFDIADILVATSERDC